MRSSVVLPQPEGPSSTTVSPRAMSSDTGSSARVPSPNVLPQAAIAHGDAVMLVLPAAHLRTPPASPQLANICIAISSGMIMTKNTSVYADATSSRIEA